MIQRIQTVYLLVVFILSIICQFSPMGYFIGPNGEQLAEMGTLMITADGQHTFTPWALCSLLIVVSLSTLLAIMLFRKRMRQIRLCIFSSLLLVGFYLIYGWFAFSISSSLEASFRPSLMASFPLVSLILEILAMRAIGADEALVRSLDRLR